MQPIGVKLELSEVIRNVSAHVDGLAAEVHAIEHAIGDELGDDFQIENSHIKRLQRLDFLRQSLEDLALLNLFIADVCLGELDPIVRKRLNLATTKSLLCAEAKRSSDTVPMEHVGDVDLF